AATREHFKLLVTNQPIISEEGHPVTDFDPRIKRDFCTRLGKPAKVLRKVSPKPKVGVNSPPSRLPGEFAITESSLAQRIPRFRRLSVERLEQRALPSGTTCTLVDGMLVLGSTDPEDAIVVRRDPLESAILVVVNDEHLQRFAASEVQGLLLSRPLN